MPTEKGDREQLQNSACFLVCARPFDRFHKASMTSNRTIFSSAIGRASVISFILCLLVIPASASSWYVDPAATGSNNGTSWANAWASLSFSGIAAGDTVYISGGPSGQTRTYNISTYFDAIPGFAYGISGSPVTYKIGQDPSHNGTAIFNGPGTGAFLYSGAPSYVAIVGDAGDGQMHFQLTGFLSVGKAGVQLRLGYINFGRIAGSSINGAIRVMSGNPSGPGFEFDHCYVYITDPNADAFGFWEFAGTPGVYDQNLIHDNVIYLPHASGSTSYMGADGVQSRNTTGLSIYNNVVVGYNMAYTGSQHQDGYQDTGNSSYVKVYNNTYLNIGNYGTYGDVTFGGLDHFLVYNNIYLIGDSSMKPTFGGACFGTEGSPPTPVAMTNIVIANNISDGYSSGGQPLSFNDLPRLSAVFTGSFLANNVIVNGGTINTTGATPTVENNVYVTVVQAASYFKSWTAYGGLSNDYHAMTLIGQGTNLSTYFITDKDGNARASSGAWAVGPYVYNGPSLALGKPSGLRIVSP